MLPDKIAAKIAEMSRDALEDELKRVYEANPSLNPIRTPITADREVPADVTIEMEDGESIKIQITEPMLKVMVSEQPYDVGIDDLDKRCRAMVELIETAPKTSELYVRNLARNLTVKLINAGRPDLATKITSAKYNATKTTTIRSGQQKFKAAIEKEFDDHVF